MRHGQGDPFSGLREFLHLASHLGAVPERDESGRLQLAEDAGTVLVLVPAGSFHMGASRDERAVNNDPDALGNEGPVSEVELDAFFIGKHEVTQPQWIKMTGSNPSAFGLGRGRNWRGRPQSLRQPVEQISAR